MRWAGVVRARWRLAVNTVLHRRRGARGRLKPVVIGALGLVLAGLVCLSFVGLFGSLATAGAPAAETAVALAWLLTGTLVGLLIFDLQEAVSTLVADTDLELLRRAPIPAPTLFLIKFADAFPRTSFLLVILAIPAVFAYQLFFPLPLWMWLLLPLQVLALWAIPLGLGNVVAIHLLRFVPARRAKATLGLLSTLTLFALWMANSFLLPRLADGPLDSMARVRELLASQGAPHWLSPGYWAASALAAAATGAAFEALRATALLLGVAALTLGLAAWSAARHLEATQMRIADRGRSRGPRTLGAGAGASPAGAGVTRTGAGPDRPRRLVGVIVRRDALLLVRDWTALGDVLTAAVLWTLLPLVGVPLMDTSPAVLARTMLVALTVGLGYEIASRAFPFEGRGWAWIRLGPVSAARWIMNKWVATAVLSAPLVFLAAVAIAISLRIPAAQIGAILSVVLPALALALAAGLWTGIAFGKSDWINPRGMLTVAGRITSTFLLLGQAGAWFFFAFLADAHRGVLPAAVILAAPALVAAALAVIPLGAAARKLSRREWA